MSSGLFCKAFPWSLEFNSIFTVYLWLSCRNWLILIVVTIYYKSGILFCNFVSLPKSHSFFYLFVINLYYPICIPLSIPISVPHVGFYEDCFTKITEVKLEGPESYPPLNWSAVLLLINIAKDEYSWLLWLLHYDQSFCMGEWNGMWKLGRHTLCSSDSVFCNDGAPPYYSFWWKPYKSLSQSENNDILAFDIFTITLYTGWVEPGELKEGPGAAEFDTAGRISCSEDR